MPESTALGLLQFLHEKEKPLYRATIENLAQQRKLRPVFVERKPRKDQYAWIREQVSRKPNQALAAHLLQIWLVAAHKQLLCDFLDGFSIAHDENGTVEVLPPSPSNEEVAKVVDGLLTKYEASLVAIYLNAFQSIDDHGWSGVAAVLAENPRLRLSN